MEQVKLGEVLLENKEANNSYHYKKPNDKPFSTGEMFEINLYENLLLWASQDDNINWVCSKNTKKLEVEDGLGSNQHGQIVYFVDYLAFAELDMLFMHGDILVNLEATTTKNWKGFGSNYFSRIKKNHKLLKKIYRVDKVQTIFLIIEEPTEELYFPENTFYEVVGDTKILSELKSLPKKDKRPLHKMWKKKTGKIYYKSELKNFTKFVKKDFFSEDVDHMLKFKSNPYFERVFLGYIAGNKVTMDLVPDYINRVFVCLNKNNKISLFYYLSGQTYEITDLDTDSPKKEKKRKQYSRSAKMLKYLFNENVLYPLSNNKIEHLDKKSDTIINPYFLR